MREALLRALSALQGGHPEEAEPLLAEALKAELSEAARARVLGLHAQALLALGQAEAAKLQVREAMRLARALGDDAGLTQLRRLNGEVYARLAEDSAQDRLRRQEAEALARPLEALLAEAETPADRAAVYLRKCNQLMDAGEPERARPLAEQGLALADAIEGAVKEQVLARLSLARVEAAPEARRALYEAALDIADAADEANLVTAVAQAAEADGLPFGPRVFGAP